MEGEETSTTITLGMALGTGDMCVHVDVHGTLSTRLRRLLWTQVGGTQREKCCVQVCISVPRCA